MVRVRLESVLDSFMSVLFWVLGILGVFGCKVKDSTLNLGLYEGGQI